MTKPEMCERVQTTADAATASTARWSPVWAMPNVTLDEAINASHVALAPSHDQRVLEFAKREPVFGVYLKAFRNEFGTQFQPTIGLAREDARKTVFTVTEFAERSEGHGVELPRLDGRVGD